MAAPATAFVVNYAAAPFGVEALIYPNLDLDPLTGQIVVVGSVPYGVTLLHDSSVILADQPGGWLKEEEYSRTAKKRAKIKLKRERRQDYVMRKIYAELKGLEPDERLLALMAEFETVEDVFKSDAQLQGELKQAYYDYIIVLQEAQAAQDEVDEMAIMLALSESL